jgi:hypothetical protein
MRGIIKTLFGDARNVAVATLCVGSAVVLLHTFMTHYAGIFLPVSLLAGAAYLAKH